MSKKLGKQYAESVSNTKTQLPQSTNGGAWNHDSSNLNGNWCNAVKVTIASIHIHQLENIFSFLTVKELESCVMPTCNYFHQTVCDNLNGLWK